MNTPYLTLKHAFALLEVCGTIACILYIFSAIFQAFGNLVLIILGVENIVRCVISACVYIKCLSVLLV